MLDRNAWTFFAGSDDWSTRVGDAVSVFSGNDILNLSWNQFLSDTWRSTANRCPKTSWYARRRILKAPGQAKAFTALRPAPGATNVYDAQAHLEYNVDGGRVMFVSDSPSTGTFSSEVRLVSLELKPLNVPP